MGASSARLCWTWPNRVETLLRRRPRAHWQRARNIRAVNTTGRSPESSGKLHGNVVFPVPAGELLHLAANYERRGNYIDSRSN